MKALVLVLLLSNQAFAQSDCSQKLEKIVSLMIKSHFIKTETVRDIVSSESTPNIDKFHIVNANEGQKLSFKTKLSEALKEIDPYQWSQTVEKVKNHLQTQETTQAEVLQVKEKTEKMLRIQFEAYAPKRIEYTPQFHPEMVKVDGMDFIVMKYGKESITLDPVLKDIEHSHEANFSFLSSVSKVSIRGASYFFTTKQSKVAFINDTDRQELPISKFENLAGEIDPKSMLFYNKGTSQNIFFSLGESGILRKVSILNENEVTLTKSPVVDKIFKASSTVLVPGDKDDKIFAEFGLFIVQFDPQTLKRLDKVRSPFGIKKLEHFKIGRSDYLLVTGDRESAFYNIKTKNFIQFSQRGQVVKTEEGTFFLRFDPNQKYPLFISELRSARDLRNPHEFEVVFPMNRTSTSVVAIPFRSYLILPSGNDTIVIYDPELKSTMAVLDIKKDSGSKDAAFRNMAIYKDPTTGQTSLVVAMSEGILFYSID